MKYEIKFTDGCLPEGHNWAICRIEGLTTLYLRESARDLPSEDAARVLEAAWEGYRSLSAGHDRRSTD